MLACGSVLALGAILAAFTLLMWAYNVVVAIAISLPFYMVGLVVRLCLVDSVDAVIQSELG